MTTAMTYFLLEGTDGPVLGEYPTWDQAEAVAHTIKGPPNVCLATIVPSDVYYGPNRWPPRTASMSDRQQALDVDATAEILGCSPWLVRRLIRDGDLRHVRLGRLIRIPRHEIERFLRESLQKGQQ